LLSFIARAIRPGDVFWDIGANVGTISAFCAHPDRRLKAVHCFEPNPTALRVLQSLFVNNPSVRVFPVAMGDAETTIQINFHPTNTHLGSIVHCPSVSVPHEAQVKTGDGLVERADALPPDVIKIDVEGFEPHVLAGLAGQVKSRSPVIFFEHLWLTEEQVRNLIPDGYVLRFIGDCGKISSGFSEKQLGHDAVLIPPHRSDLLEVSEV
jgi:FkbM family methyltransferase